MKDIATPEAAPSGRTALNRSTDCKTIRSRVMTIVVHSASDLALATCLAEQKLPIQSLLSEQEHASVRVQTMSFEQALVSGQYNPSGPISRYYWKLKLTMSVFKDECWSSIMSRELTPEQLSEDASLMRAVLSDRFPGPSMIEPRIGKEFGRNNAKQIHISFAD
jgi:hypothetical protein